MKFVELMEVLEEVNAVVVNERENGDCIGKIYKTDGLYVIMEYIDIEGVKEFLALEIVSEEFPHISLKPKKGVANRDELIKTIIKRGY